MLGSRLTTFAYAGSPLPYYDQWLAEYNHLLLRAAGGGDLLATLFLPHNEHFVVLPKLACLLGYLLNGYWDVEFLAVLCAVVRALVAVSAFRLLSSNSPKPGWAIFIACAVVFALPISGYNQLNGFQIAFYFSEWALLSSIHAVVHWNSSRWRALQLVLSAIAGLLSLSSAAAIPAGTVIVHLATKEFRRGFWFAWGASLLLAVVAVAIAAPQHATPWFAGRGGDLLFYFLTLLSWPIDNAAWGLAIVIFFGASFIRLRGEAGLHSSFAAAALGIGVFGAANALFFAVGRSPGLLHSRHWETLTLLALSLFALMAHYMHRPGKYLKLISTAGALIAVFYLSFLASRVYRETVPYLREAHRDRAEVLAHYRRILLSNAVVAESLKINAALERRDYAFFDDPVGRFAIHPLVALNLRNAPLPALALLAPELVPARSPSVVSRLVRGVKRSGAFLLAIGFACSIAAVIRSGAVPTAPARSPRDG